MTPKMCRSIQSITVRNGIRELAHEGTAQQLSFDETHPGYLTDIIKRTRGTASAPNASNCARRPADNPRANYPDSFKQAIK